MTACSVIVYVLQGGTIAVRCAPEDFTSPDDDVRSVSIEWFDARHRPIASRKQTRVTVDDKQNLEVRGAEPEDTGRYTCLMSVALGQARTIELIHIVHFYGISVFLRRLFSSMLFYKPAVVCLKLIRIGMFMRPARYI